MNKIVLNSVISSLLLATSAMADHAPSISVDTQGITNRNGYDLGVASTNIVIPLFENNDKVVFGDLRFSRTDHDVNAIHFGLGVRKKINDLTVGFNSFYDRYIAEKEYSQYVGGIEAFYDIFKVRGTFYYPTSDDFKGLEVEGGMQVWKIFLSAKPYYFFHQAQDSINGIGFYAKYERPLKAVRLYAKLGYQLDTNYGHQVIVQFGAKIALKQNNNGDYKTILPVERNMFIYGDYHNQTGGRVPLRVLKLRALKDESADSKKDLKTYKEQIEKGTKELVKNKKRLVKNKKREGRADKKVHEEPQKPIKRNVEKLERDRSDISLLELRDDEKIQKKEADFKPIRDEQRNKEAKELVEEKKREGRAEKKVHAEPQKPIKRNAEKRERFRGGKTLLQYIEDISGSKDIDVNPSKDEAIDEINVNIPITTSELPQEQKPQAEPLTAQDEPQQVGNLVRSKDIDVKPSNDEAVDEINVNTPITTIASPQEQKPQLETLTAQDEPQQVGNLVRSKDIDVKPSNDEAADKINVNIPITTRGLPEEQKPQAEAFTSQDQSKHIEDSAGSTEVDVNPSKDEKLEKLITILQSNLEVLDDYNVVDETKRSLREEIQGFVDDHEAGEATFDNGRAINSRINRMAKAVGRKERVHLTKDVDQYYRTLQLI